MDSIAIRLIVFAWVFGAALFGMFLGAVLQEQHLSADSKDTVRLAMGMIATMAALVMVLLVASAKSFYDAQSSELTEVSGAIFLTVEMYTPFKGLIQISSAPLRNALAHLGQ
jgi:hypothetical protein